MNRRKLTDVYYKSAVDMENIKHCCIAIDLLYLSNQKKTANVAVQVRGSKKSFVVAEVQKIPQTYRKLADLRLRTTYCVLQNLRLRSRVLNCDAQHCLKASYKLQRSKAKKYCTGRTVSLALHQQRNYHHLFRWCC